MCVCVCAESEKENVPIAHTPSPSSKHPKSKAPASTEAQNDTMQRFPTAHVKDCDDGETASAQEDGLKTVSDTTEWIGAPGLEDSVSEDDPTLAMRLLQVPVVEDAHESSCAWLRTLTEDASSLYEPIRQHHELFASAEDKESSTSWQSRLDVWGSSLTDIGAEFYDEADSLNVKELTNEAPLQHAPQLKRLPLDETVPSVPAPLLSHESARILAKIYRKNAACILVQDSSGGSNIFKALPAPSKLSAWHAAYSDIPAAISRSEQHGLHQLLMPTGPSSRDNNAPSDALQHIVACAAQTLQRICSSLGTLPPRPLTSILLNIPSVWTHDCFASLAAANRFEESFERTQIPVDSSCINSGLIVEEELDGEDHLPISHSKATQEAELNALTATESARTRSTTMFVMSDQTGRATTEDLVQGFLGITSNHVAVAEQESRSTAPAPSEPTKAKGAHQLQLPIEHLARPVLWDLARKKVIRVNSSSIQCALETLSLELLESVIHQQQVTVKRISENPSAFTHDAIIDACSSFRQAAWLHTLRYLEQAR